MHSAFVRPPRVFERLDVVFRLDIEPAKRGRKTGDVKNGTKTLRFKADGRASVEEVDDKMVKAIDRINGLLETFMGINDSDLGTFVLESMMIIFRMVWCLSDLLFMFQLCLRFETTNVILSSSPTNLGSSRR